MRGTPRSAVGRASSIRRIEHCGLHPSVATMLKPPHVPINRGTRGCALADQRSDVPHFAGDAVAAARCPAVTIRCVGGPVWATLLWRSLQ